MDIEQLIDRLDFAYQDSLNHLGAYTQSSEELAERMREELGLAPSAAPLLPIAPERALSPQDAFRALASFLVQRVRSHIDPLGSKSRVPVENLIDWANEPPRHNLSVLEHTALKIEYARGKSLREFYRRLVIRLTPEAVPGDASELAAHELLDGFGVRLPSSFILPTSHCPFGTAVNLRLSRAENQMPWHLTPDQLILIDRVLIALAAVCAITGQQLAASLFSERGAAVIQRLRHSTRQYSAGDMHPIGQAARIVLQRDSVQFQLTDEVWDATKAVLAAHIAGLKFVANS